MKTSELYTYPARGGIPSVISKTEVSGEWNLSQYEARNAVSMATTSEITVSSGMRKSFRR
jgi:hypothetical protein